MTTDLEALETSLALPDPAVLIFQLEESGFEVLIVSAEIIGGLF
jgi:hypothetical protein